ncbi:hypothetical protein ABLU95_10880 [Klebsiella sp. GG_Kp146]|uniref:hypothetical protein n=1 Tax=Klebsiella sp. GG_Kp146 TaxID=3153457 RepID=UPI0032B48EE3
MSNEIFWHKIFETYVTPYAHFLFGFSIIVLLGIYYAKVSPWLEKRVGLKLTTWFDYTIAIVMLMIFLTSLWFLTERTALEVVFNTVRGFASFLVEPISKIVQMSMRSSD